MVYKQQHYIAFMLFFLQTYEEKKKHDTTTLGHCIIS